jgi:AraC family transcriptional regulator of adaptative response / DNA-3-methyladenine glycosylase II
MTRHLSYSGAYDWQAALAFLSRRAVDGVEQVSGGIYRRTVQCGGVSGMIAVAHAAKDSALVLTLLVDEDVAEEAVERARRMFDVDADLPAINTHLKLDSWMAPLVAARPAVRVPGGWDGFEVAARSILGQQVTVERARHLNGVLAERCGAEPPDGGADLLTRVFPTAQQVLDADLSSMGMPGARAATLKTVAAAAIEDPRLFDRSASVEETVARLRRLRGVGDWTAHYIAMRACREPDAFPAGDAGLLRGAADPDGNRPTPAALLARAEAWRPWRAYAAHHLWNSTARDGVQAVSAPVTVDA